MPLTATAKTARLHARILAQLDELLALARDPAELARQRPEVSAWSVAQQIEHLVLSDRSVLDGLEKIESGELASRGGGAKFLGRMILLTGWIPRGRGKAPERARPSGLDGERTAAALEAVKERFERLGLARLEAAPGTFSHPIFGHLDGRRWLRFIDVHQRHHRRIIDDIRRAG
jgi:hypothetical protein